MNKITNPPSGGFLHYKDMRLILVLMTVLLSLETSAQQPYLYLNQIGKRRNYKFFEKETIRFKLKGDDRFSTGLITGFGDHYISFDRNIIALDSIEVIDIRNKKRRLSFPAAMASIAAFAGYGYVLIDWFNVTVVDGDDADVNTEVLAGATGLLGLSLGLQAIQRKYFRVGRGNSITVIQPPGY